MGTRVPWICPHLPSVIITSGDKDLFGWMECYTVDAVVVSLDGGRELKATSPREVGAHWNITTATVRVARFTSKHISSLNAKKM